MDLWNNAVGRKYGKVAENRDELAKKLQEALEKGELITDPDDPRKYRGNESSQIDINKPVAVIQESKTGRNKYFLDLVKLTVFSREEFVSEIKQGNYAGYLVANVESIETPVSKPDGVSANNLG